MSKPNIDQSSDPAKEIPFADVSITFDVHDYFSNDPKSITVEGDAIGRILRYAYGVCTNLRAFADDNVNQVAAELRGVAFTLRALSEADSSGVDFDSACYALSEQLHHLAARLEAETDAPGKATIQLPTPRAAEGGTR